ncbi:unnamed protein product [Adineta steineri]|uniref:Plasma membrane ATPase n=1 Tax=Adineta steineri TaxID=433720 RepID=A0A818GVL8_9BILA|nr:unnamed protein product [Adineta steineri]CAF1435151.1 unnamed protein product [Adineta steineri]CAF3496533.1 unnamed protein product [Adineta steineri]CAF3604647.1 unnamed protein product [Adineta steineri]
MESSTINIPENAIRILTLEEMYDIEKYNLSTMELNDVFNFLNASFEGLTDEEVNYRLEKFGCNRDDGIKEKSRVSQFLLFLRTPFLFMMIFANIIATPEWEVFLGIILLLLINSVTGFYLQSHTRNIWKEFMKSLEPMAKVKRNSQWKMIPRDELVPGDIIHIEQGDISPADARLIAIDERVAMDQAGLTGEPLFVNKAIGDEIFQWSTCNQGDAVAIVHGTGHNTFAGRAIKCTFGYCEKIYMEKFYSTSNKFYIISIIIFVIAEALIMYTVYHYKYRRGINNILVLLFGGIPISMATILTMILVVGAKQLSEHKVIVTSIEVIEKLASVTILYSNRTGMITLGNPVIDKTSIKKYSNIEIDDIVHYAAIASLTNNPNAIDLCITSTYSDIKKIYEGIKRLNFKEFNATNTRTEITYRIFSDGTVHRITKGIPHSIWNLCTRDKTNDQLIQLNADVEEFAQKGLSSLAVAIEDVPNGDAEGKGNGFKLIGLLPISDRLRTDIKQTIDRAHYLSIQVKMITSDGLTIAKVIGRCAGIGDNIFSSNILKDDIDDQILYADGFADVYPEHEYTLIEKLQKMDHIVAVTGDSIHDAPVLSKADVGITVADASDAARSSADIILTESGLSIIIEAIHDSRQIIKRLTAYAIYACSMTIRTFVGFSILIFAFKFDFPPFMVLILVILNDGALVTISKDQTKPCLYPNNLNSFEIFIYGIVYGIYLAISTVAFLSVILKTSFFSDKFGVIQFVPRPQTDLHPEWNHPQLHSIIYLQISIISQALIFITCSRRSFFLERPSIILICTFSITQLIATFIAVYANWTFTNIEGCGWSWARIIWIWDFLWFFPLDLIKFTLCAYFDPKKKQQQRLAKVSRNEPLAEEQTDHHSTLINA